jgi:uncharacterized cupin superfamily protein
MTVKKINGVTYASLSDAEFTDAPDYGGTYKGRYWEIDRSADGRRSITLFEQSGDAYYEYPCSEVVVVQRGSISCTFDDGQVITLRAGDVGFFEKGVKGMFSCSEDFSDLAIFLSDDEPISVI